jgi:type II secretory pathway pseudopilin PulG
MPTTPVLSSENKHSEAMQAAQATRHGERGFAMAALLVAMAVMAVALSMLLPVWHTLTVREKEAELMWRGQQYDRAIQLYRKKNASPGPPSIDALVQGRFLRKKFKDPITNDDFVLVGVNAGAPSGPGATQAKQPPIGFGQLVGSVRSKSKAHSFREPDGATTYDAWTFSYVAWKAPNQTPPGGATPGAMPGGMGNGRSGSGSGGFGSGFGSGGTGKRGPGQGRPPQQGRPPGGEPPTGPGPGRDSQGRPVVIESPPQ